MVEIDQKVVKELLTKSVAAALTELSAIGRGRGARKFGRFKKGLSDHDIEDRKPHLGVMHLGWL